MNVHYAALRGEEVDLASHGDTVADPDSEDPAGSRRAAMLEAKRSEAHDRHWALPSDEGTARAEAALAKVADGSREAPTAAAAAFAAAEEAARKRLERLPEGAAGQVGLCYSWCPDEQDEDLRRTEVLTKRVNGDENLDFSMFHQDIWLKSAKRGEAMLMEQQPGVFCYRDSLPNPQSKVPGCQQVKLRQVKVNTEMKICAAYSAMAAGGGADRSGFLLGASLGRFITLAKEKSDGAEAKNGGDLGWVTKEKIDPRIAQVAFHTAKGACSPPFRIALADFRMLLVEDRR